MLDFDVNLSILFQELPLLDRPGAAAALGFSAVELWWPFAAPTPSSREMDDLVDALAAAGTRLALLNLDGGDLHAGERGILSLPTETARFAANLEAAIELAGKTGCRRLNALYGNRDGRFREHEQDDVAMENLLSAARAARSIGADVVLEPINTLDCPRYPICSTAAALDRIDAAKRSGATNVALLADLYHLARMGEDLDAALRLAGDRVGHVQIADCPGRREPGTGLLGRAGLLGPLERSGYEGCIGLEYHPSGASSGAFAWLLADPPGRAARAGPGGR